MRRPVTCDRGSRPARECPRIWSLTVPHPLERLVSADTVIVPGRTLNRRFAEELGTTPSGWLTRSRVRRAQRLLETTDWPIDRVAAASGLGSAQNLRSRFGPLVGTSPARYRAALGPSVTG
ncbi:helix-turn-helix domain-containing protein [Kineosporia sp. NBRC 101731]|uniref:helix-turn-helix domain-containing protein n=1 Tax=Kineosporia sp. NBRC 101731 TaxID=3032199 RepID=UPI0024A212FC|nr:helix-turn-helix domain-containing protein [Kineosporia sp. NBRC 101731]GLY29312.1 hypothetical protein Kisp02_26770 [Kineosporia sp. NBRC 101731]